MNEIQEIEGFEGYLKEKGFTSHTVKKYTARANHLLRWAKGKQFTYKVLLNYIQDLQSEREKPALLNARLLAIRHYFDYLGTYNPAKNLHIKGTKKKILHDFLDKNELENLYESYQGKEKVILGLLIYQGLKAAELERIELVHLDFKKGTLYVPASKKAGARLLKLESVQLYELMQLAAEQKENYLLGNPLQNRLFALFKQLRKLNPKTCGEHGRTIRNAHQLRGSRIVYWIQTEGLRQAQYKAGHTTVGATEEYRQIDLKDLQQRVNQHHPLQ